MPVCRPSRLVFRLSLLRNKSNNQTTKVQTLLIHVGTTGTCIDLLEIFLLVYRVQESRFIVVTAIMVNLDELKGEILTIGETIKALKSTTPIDKDAIGAAVTSLLAAKQLYADHNNGIGVDGQPFVKDPPSKKDKKKSVAAGTETTVGDASKQVGSFSIITLPGIVPYSTCDGITQPFSSIFLKYD